MKKSLSFIGAALLMAAPAFADEVPQAAFNCDYQPSCEVAPGIYGKMSSPVTSKFKMSIGGYVKLDYAYNSENLGSSGVISPSSGAMPSKALTSSAAAANQSQSILSLRQSRLWFKVDGPTLLGAKTGSLIEGDFYGDNSAATESPMFRLRLAYGTIDWANTQILFGQAYDMFAPMLANTQDFRSGAPYGAPNSPRIPQIRLTEKLNITKDDQVKFVLAVQDPAQTADNNSAAPTTYSSNVNYDGQLSYVNKHLGTSPGYFGMSMNPMTLTLFGQYSKNRVLSNNQNIDSWGYGAYAFVPVLKSQNGMDRTMTMSFEGQTYLAANMAYNAATASTFLNSTAAATPPAGSLHAAKDWAATGQLIFYPTQNLGITGGWGARYAFDKSDYAHTASYQRFTQQVFANVSYDFNAAVRLAAEYQNMKTSYGNANAVGGPSVIGDDNTARLCAYYFF